MLDRLLHTAGVDHAQGAPAIRLESLGVKFGPVTALEDISLEIESGARVAVVGPNGAGKSTLFNVLAGLLAPSSGTATLHGHRPERHLCTAYLTQSKDVDWDFPVCVEDVVMMGRGGLLGLGKRPGPIDRQRVQQSLEVVGIPHLAQRQIGELSGGQKQRMFIARALAQEAEILLLDEPLTGLDLASQEQIFAILDELAKRHVTVLFATHDLNEAAEHFQRILLLDRRLIAFAPPREVLTNEFLERAYGGRVRVLDTADGPVVIGDTGGHHDHEGHHA